MSFKLKGLIEKRGKVKHELEKLGDKMRREERAMSAEEKAAFEQLKTDWVTLGEQIQAVTADIAAIDTLLAANPDNNPAADPGAGGDPPADPTMQENSRRRVPGREDRNHRPRGGDGASLTDGHREIFSRRQQDIKLARQAWARRQYGIPLTQRHVDACKRTGINPRSKTLTFRLGDPADRARRLQERALTVTTTAGGYLIAEDYSFELESKLVDFSNVRGICREIQTETGADLPWPTEDDTGNTGELLGINTEVAYADPVFSSVTFGAYKFSSKGVLVPQELIQDAAFDVDGMVFGEIGTRIGRIQGTYFTTGTGTSEPKGVVTCASAGITTALATAFTADELTRLAHSVDPAYRLDPSCGYMLKDDTLAYALTLKDSAGRPLLRDSYAVGAGTNANKSGLTLNGFPVFVNQKMTGLTSNLPATATKHVLFGAMSKFVVRDAGTVRVSRLDERWAEKDQVGFIGFLRSDSNCVNTAAIKYMLQA